MSVQVTRKVYRESRLWRVLDDPSLQPLDEPDRIVSAQELGRRMDIDPSYLTHLRRRGRPKGAPRQIDEDGWEAVWMPQWVAERAADALGMPIESLFRSPIWLARQGARWVEVPEPDEEPAPPEPVETVLPGYMTLKDAAARYGTRPNTLAVAVQEGRLDGIRVGRQYAVTAQAVEEYLANRRAWRVPTRKRVKAGRRRRYG